jgi:hypothetical protein
MFSGGTYDGFVHINSGKSNGRSVHDILSDGQITITGKDCTGMAFQRVVKFTDGEIQDNRLRVDNKTIHHIVYGRFESAVTGKGKEIVHFKKGGKRKHGKARRNEKLFGNDGACHSWYKNGTLVRQTFVYDNRHRAYEYGLNRKSCTIKDPEGNVLYEVSGQLDGRMSAYHGGHSVFNKPMADWFNYNHPFEVRRKGRPYFGGQMQNNQKIGKWIVQGKAFFYEHGVAIPRKLYETPPDQLDVRQILKLSNAQVRMALMAKIGPDRIATAGKEIHREGDMRLYDIKGYEVRILRVRCPTTKSFYFLRVPKDATECEEARQWTFHVDDGIGKPIKFAIET